MANVTTRREACETRPGWTGKNGICAEGWERILDGLYDGKGAGTVHQELNLPAGCSRSLQKHRQDHLGYILFQQGVRLKDKRLQMAGTLHEAYRKLMEWCFRLSMDEAEKPGFRLRGAELAQREMADLYRLAEAVKKEFESVEDERQGKGVADVQELVQRIAADVFGIHKHVDDNR